MVAISAAPTATSANQSTYTVSGSCTTSDGNVMVSVSGATPATQAAACASGNWSASFDVSAIADGTNAISVSANQSDAAGNTGTATSVTADKTVNTGSSSSSSSGGGGSFPPALVLLGLLAWSLRRARSHNTY
jgi:hypothetical protein